MGAGTTRAVGFVGSGRELAVTGGWVDSGIAFRARVGLAGVAAATGGSVVVAAGASGCDWDWDWLSAEGFMPARTRASSWESFSRASSRSTSF